MSNAENELLSKKQANMQIVSDKAVYCLSKFYSTEDMMQYVEQILNFLGETEYASYFTNVSGIMEGVKCQFSPLPVVKFSYIPEGTKTKVEVDNISRRSKFEAISTLNNYFSIHENPSNAIYYSRDNINKLIRIIVDKMSPRTSDGRILTVSSLKNRDFNILSGVMYVMVKNCPELVNVMKGLYPDGTVKRMRNFKDGFSQEDVDEERERMMEERQKEINIIEVQYIHLKHTLEDIPYIFKCMNRNTTDDHMKHILTICEILENICNILINSALSQNSHESETSNDDGFIISVNSKKINSQLLTEISNASKSKLDEYYSQCLNIFDGQSFLSDKNYVGPLFSSILKSIIEKFKADGVDISEEIRTSVEKIIGLRTETINRFIDLIPINGSIKLDSDMAQEFCNKGREPIKSYIFRYISHMDRQEDENVKFSMKLGGVFLENCLKLFVSSARYRVEFSERRKDFPIDPSNVEIEEEDGDVNYYKISFAHENLRDLISKITGNEDLKYSDDFKNIQTILSSQKEQYAKAMEEIELSLDEKFGESKVIPAVELPEIQLDPIGSTISWIENYKQNIIFDTREILQNQGISISQLTFAETVFPQIVEDFENNLIDESEDSNANHVSYYKELSSPELNSIRINIAKYLQIEKQQPLFTDFTFQMKDLAIGRILQFDIKKTSVIINGKKYELGKDLFQKSDNYGARPIFESGVKTLVESHFKIFFSQFCVSGGSVTVEILKSTSVDAFTGKEKLHLTVEATFPVPQDAFFCTKFCTKGLASFTSDVLDYEEISKITDIPWMYYMKLIKTPEQMSVISGENGTKLLNHMIQSEGLIDNYPFVTNGLESRIKEIISIFTRGIGPRIRNTSKMPPSEFGNSQFTISKNDTKWDSSAIISQYRSIGYETNTKEQENLFENFFSSKMTSKKNFKSKPTGYAAKVYNGKGKFKNRHGKNKHDGYSENRHSRDRENRNGERRYKESKYKEDRHEKKKSPTSYQGSDPETTNSKISTSTLYKSETEYESSGYDSETKPKKEITKKSKRTSYYSSLIEDDSDEEKVVEIINAPEIVKDEEKNILNFENYIGFLEVGKGGRIRKPNRKDKESVRSVTPTSGLSSPQVKSPSQQWDKTRSGTISKEVSSKVFKVPTLNSKSPESIQSKNSKKSYTNNKDIVLEPSRTISPMRSKKEERKTFSKNISSESSREYKRSEKLSSPKKIVQEIPESEDEENSSDEEVFVSKKKEKLVREDDDSEDEKLKLSEKKIPVEESDEESDEEFDPSML